jgi:hypothetical protein
MYGPITTLRRENRVVKHIPWSAFTLGDQDWLRVVDARDILNVSAIYFLFKYVGNRLLGFKSYSAVFLLRKGTHAMAITSSSRRASDSMGEETRCSKVLSLSNGSYRWPQQNKKVLFAA